MSRLFALFSSRSASDEEKFPALYTTARTRCAGSRENPVVIETVPSIASAKYQLNTSDISHLLGAPRTPECELGHTRARKIRNREPSSRFEHTLLKSHFFTHASTMQNPKTSFSLVDRRAFRSSCAETEDAFPTGESIVDRGISPFSLRNRNFVDRGLLREGG